MAKKIRFPLEMGNGVEVRSMEELRRDFSLPRVLEYVKNDKLVIWLRDRYENDIADKIEQLDKADNELPKKVSEIFDVPYDEEAIKDAAERMERLNRLKQFTDEREFIDNIDSVAFDQDEMYDLLDEDAKTIFLCGDRFSIPLSKKGVSYVGINNPIAVIDSKVEVDWSEREISIEGATFDEKYQAVIDSAAATKEKLYEKAVETVKSENKNSVRIGDYSNKTYLNFMLSPEDRENVGKLYNMAKKELECLSYDIDADTVAKKKLVYENNIIGLAEAYIENDEDTATKRKLVYENNMIGLAEAYIENL